MPYKDKEKQRESERRWLKRNRDKYLERRRKYYERNREKVRSYAIKYRENNKGKEIERTRIYDRSVSICRMHAAINELSTIGASTQKTAQSA